MLFATAATHNAAGAFRQPPACPNKKDAFRVTGGVFSVERETV
jgi:hypothetical protein